MAFMAAAAPYLQYAGMAVSAAGAFSSSEGSKAAYGAQAQVAENNARVAEWQAQDALRRGGIAASDKGIRTNQLKGSQRAALAANGVDLGVGSALEVLSDTDYFGRPDQAFMVNFRVADLHAMLEQLRAAGVEVIDKVDESEYGKFGWAVDPEGNRFELWEPPAGG